MLMKVQSHHIEITTCSEQRKCTWLMNDFDLRELLLFALPAGFVIKFRKWGKHHPHDTMLNVMFPTFFEAINSVISFSLKFSRRNGSPWSSTSFLAFLSPQIGNTWMDLSVPAAFLQALQKIHYSIIGWANTTSSSVKRKFLLFLSWSIERFRSFLS